MDEAIKKVLLDIEATHGIRILLAVESGSRAWGFESPDSDYDVRFIYMHEPDWYCSVIPERLSVEKSDTITLKRSLDLDLHGWDLRKAFQLMHNSNPTLVEWVQSPTVYQNRNDFLSYFKSVTKEFFHVRPLAHHYRNLANSHYKEYVMENPLQVRLKVYLYILRSILAARYVLSNFDQMPPVRLNTLLKQSFHTLSPVARTEIEKLLFLKKSKDEIAEVDRLPELDRWISDSLELIYQSAQGLSSDTMKGSVAILNGKFRETLKLFQNAQ